MPPAEAPAEAYRASSAAYGLTAAPASLSNVPVNLLNMLISVPAWEVEAMGRLADAMTATGSWQAWGPTNVFGFDEQDPPKLTALIDMLIPIQPFSSVFGEQISWWAQANLPMNAGCAAAQSACPNPRAMLNSMFTVPFSTLFEGYQFPAVTNPFTGEQTSWSGRYVKLDRNGAFNALQGFLTAPAVGVETVSAADAFAAMSRLAASLNDAFYPFVQNSEWFDDKHTVLAPLFRSLAPVLCASCDPSNPYDNQWLKNYGAKSPAGVSASATASVPAAAATVATVPESAPSVVSTESRGVARPRSKAAFESPSEPAPAHREAPDPSVGGHRSADGDSATTVSSIRQKMRSSTPTRAHASRDASAKSGSASAR